MLSEILTCLSDLILLISGDTRMETQCRISKNSGNGCLLRARHCERRFKCVNCKLTQPHAVDMIPTLSWEKEASERLVFYQWAQSGRVKVQIQICSNSKTKVSQDSNASL